MVFFPKYGLLVRRAVAAGGGTPMPADPPISTELHAYPPIPPAYEALPWPQLRSLASGLQGDGDERPIYTKADALARIEAEMNRRARIGSA